MATEQPNKNLLPSDRGGKWRKPDPNVKDVSWREVNLVNSMMDFLTWQDTVGGNVWTNARKWVLDQRLSDPQQKQFMVLLETYLRRYPEKREESQMQERDSDKVNLKDINKIAKLLIRYAPTANIEYIGYRKALVWDVREDTRVWPELQAAFGNAVSWVTVYLLRDDLKGGYTPESGALIFSAPAVFEMEGDASVDAVEAKEREKLYAAAQSFKKLPAEVPLEPMAARKLFARVLKWRYQTGTVVHELSHVSEHVQQHGGTWGGPSALFGNVARSFSPKHVATQKYPNVTKGLKRSVPSDPSKDTPLGRMRGAAATNAAFASLDQIQRAWDNPTEIQARLLAIYGRLMAAAATKKSLSAFLWRINTFQRFLDYYIALHEPGVHALLNSDVFPVETKQRIYKRLYQMWQEFKAKLEKKAAKQRGNDGAS